MYKVSLHAQNAGVFRRLNREPQKLPRPDLRRRGCSVAPNPFHFTLGVLQLQRLRPQSPTGLRLSGDIYQFPSNEHPHLHKIPLRFAA